MQPHLHGHIKLCDFGLAGEFTPSGATTGAAHATQARPRGGFTALLGTPEYIAPEIVRALQA